MLDYFYLYFIQIQKKFLKRNVENINLELTLILLISSQLNNFFLVLSLMQKCERFFIFRSILGDLRKGILKYKSYI